MPDDPKPVTFEDLERGIQAVIDATPQPHAFALAPEHERTYSFNGQPISREAFAELMQRILNPE